MLKKLILLFIVGIMLGATLAIIFQPKPKPSGTVTINPTAEQKKEASKVVTVDHQILITDPDGILPGDKRLIPVTITLTDQESGLKTPCSTSAQLERLQNGDLSIYMTEEVAFTTPKPPIKTWAVGGYYSNTGIGGYVQKDFLVIQNKRFEASFFTRVEMDQDFAAKAGIEVRF